MTTLLSARQAAQIARTSKAAASASGEAPAALSAYEIRAGLRRELSGLVAAHHHRTGAPHGAIHAQLRDACGGPPIALASAEQIQQRIDALRAQARR